jgi:hypothetical protein
MTPDELATKLTARVDFMILQYLPRPTCASKQKAHAELVREVKELIACKLGGGGLNIEIKV